MDEAKTEGVSADWGAQCVRISSRPRSWGRARDSPTKTQPGRQPQLGAHLWDRGAKLDGRRVEKRHGLLCPVNQAVDRRAQSVRPGSDL